MTKFVTYIDAYDKNTILVTTKKNEDDFLDNWAVDLVSRTEIDDTHISIEVTNNPDFDVN